VDLIRKAKILMKKPDQIAGMIILLFSGFVIEESFRIPHETVAAGRTEFAPPPGFLPFWAGVILAGLSILLIVSASLRAADRQKKKTFPGGRALLSVFLLTTALGAYIFMLDVLGYLVDTFLLNTFLLRVVMQARWKLSLAVALLASVSLYAIFQVMLEVSLPRNMFGF
jgi:putative tricarboxylic transport membrane protein